MTTPNADMARFWTDDAGPSWVAERERLDERLAPFTRLLIDRLDLRSGEAVLDVGCGSGASTVAIARAVGAEGSVTGADVSSTMLDCARGRSDRAAEGAPIVWLEADAQTAAFEAGSFDAVTSRFGVMFFEDPVAAFENLRRALCAGGRLVFVCWQDPSENAWFALGAEELSEVLDIPDPPVPNTPGPFGLADPARTHALLDAAGFSEIEIDDVRVDLPFSGTVDEMVAHQLSIGPVGAAVRQAKPDAEALATARARLRDVIAEHAVAEGLAADAAAWLVSARP